MRATAPFAAAVAAATAVALLTGCTSTRESIADQAATGASAVETALLAVETDRAGHSTVAVTGTTLTDALRELGDASASTDELDPATADERRLRAETAAALRDGIDAVNRAREAMRASTSLAPAQAGLEDAAGALDRIAKAGGTR